MTDLLIVRATDRGRAVAGDRQSVEQRALAEMLRWIAADLDLFAVGNTGPPHPSGGHITGPDGSSIGEWNYDPTNPAQL